jgi:hypothetical protein
MSFILASSSRPVVSKAFLQSRLQISAQLQRPAGMRAAQFNVSLGVVKMADLKWAISMTRRGQF